ncbi:MAG: biotin/lipoyl-binding protein [Candidatus Ozemobacteraceae bacterium]
MTITPVTLTQPANLAVPLPAIKHAGHAHAAGESCGASAAIKHAGHAHAVGESCGTFDGHDHGLKADVGLKPVAELYSMGCEHGINSVKCDDCRYEIGAVKITDMLAKMVKTDVLHKTKLKQAVNFRGELEYDNNLLRTVTSPVLGVVATMNVRVGDSVKAGQLLAVLESRELAGTALELQKLSSELGLAQKKYMSARSF